MFAPRGGPFRPATLPLPGGYGCVNVSAIDWMFGVCCDDGRVGMMLKSMPDEDQRPPRTWVL